MASSLEYSNFLIHLCETKNPKKVLDLGSGFVSFALRKYRKDSNSNFMMVTVDTDEKWLMKTSNYLKDKKLPTDNLITLTKLLELTESFDLISYDIGYYQSGIRQQILPYIIENYVSEGTFVLFDDMHIAHYQMFVLEYLNNFHFIMMNTRSKTLDRFGRYAMLFTNIKRENYNGNKGKVRFI
jgi:hypothetical protein